MAAPLKRLLTGQRSARIGGLYGSSQAFLLASVARAGHPVLVLAAGPKEVQSLSLDLATFLGVPPRVFPRGRPPRRVARRMAKSSLRAWPCSARCAKRRPGGGPLTIPWLSCVRSTRSSTPFRRAPCSMQRTCSFVPEMNTPSVSWPNTSPPPATSVCRVSRRPASSLRAVACSTSGPGVRTRRRASTSSATRSRASAASIPQRSAVVHVGKASRSSPCPPSAFASPNPRKAPSC